MRQTESARKDSKWIAGEAVEASLPKAMVWPAIRASWPGVSKAAVEIAESLERANRLLVEQGWGKGIEPIQVSMPKARLPSRAVPWAREAARWGIRKLTPPILSLAGAESKWRAGETSWAGKMGLAWMIIGRELITELHDALVPWASEAARAHSVTTVMGGKGESARMSTKTSIVVPTDFEEGYPESQKNERVRAMSPEQTRLHMALHEFGHARRFQTRNPESYVPPSEEAQAVMRFYGFEGKASPKEQAWSALGFQPWFAREALASDRFGQALSPQLAQMLRAQFEENYADCFALMACRNDPLFGGSAEQAFEKIYKFRAMSLEDHEKIALQENEPSVRVSVRSHDTREALLELKERLSQDAMMDAPIERVEQLIMECAQIGVARSLLGLIGHEDPQLAGSFWGPLASMAMESHQGEEPNDGNAESGSEWLARKPADLIEDLGSDAWLGRALEKSKVGRIENESLALALESALAFAGELEKEFGAPKSEPTPTRILGLHPMVRWDLTARATKGLAPIESLTLRMAERSAAGSTIGAEPTSPVRVIKIKT